MNYKLIDHGIENCQYLIPRGTVFTPYTNSQIGVGDTFQEAVDDALLNIALSFDTDESIASKLDKLIRADYKTALASESPSAYAEACKAYAAENGCTVEEAEEADFDCDLYYYVEILY